MIKSGFWAGSPVAEPAAEQNLARRMIIAFLIGSGGGGGDMLFWLGPEGAWKCLFGSAGRHDNTLLCSGVTGNCYARCVCLWGGDLFS